MKGQAVPVNSRCQAFNKRYQGVGRKRFDQILCGAQSQSLGDIIFLGPGGHQNHGQGTCGGVFLQELQNFQTTQFGHHAVKYNDCQSQIKKGPCRGVKRVHFG
jgi:hypothetical protein